MHFARQAAGNEQYSAWWMEINGCQLRCREIAL
jgi:hypothetical protein